MTDGEFDSVVEILGQINAVDLGPHRPRQRCQLDQLLGHGPPPRRRS